ncbi:MAG: DsbA family protein [Candidatus Moranbacteria bacterium]|nr:DsbA family protein [Candidatus Moranbacteria bacterium]
MNEEKKVDSHENEGGKIESEEEIRKKREKNLISLSILLAGLLLGSLFVDLSQLVKGGGISQKILNEKDVFQLNGKTWVAYSDPIIDVTVVNDEDCEECNIDEALVWFRKIVPTMLANKVEYDSEEGNEMIKDFGIKYLPIFIFSKEIEDTEFYAQAQPLFTQKNEKYVLDASKLGLPSGKYVEIPEIGENDIKIGPDDAKVKLIEFSDFQCPYCQLFHNTIGDIIEEYGDKVQLVFKNLPLDSIHPRARDAAMAAECANEQWKFKEYADKLFANQKTWSEGTGNGAFTNYASQLSLNTSQFNQCLTERKYKDKIESDLKEADEFGISGTPALFINDTFKNGVVQLDELKKVIDEKLSQ